MIPVATSITHQHLLSTIATEAGERTALKVVDIGCGGGVLIRYLQTSLPQLLPNCAIEVDGFDVSDFAPEERTNLEATTPTVRTGEPWPYSDSSCDIMISNQVLEHVSDEKLFFSEIARCLKPDGVSIHLFPLKNMIWEGHVCVPLAHRIPRPGFIRAMAKIFGTEKGKNIPGGHEREFGECAADYIRNYTAYRSQRQFESVAETNKLNVSFDYTPYFYTSKLRAMANRPPKMRYSKRPFLENVSSHVLRYVSSITLVLRHRS
jgi:SAM-dependent methyltransferase